MNEIEVSVHALEADLDQAGYFTLTLNAESVKMSFSLLIGMAEAQAIQLELDRIKPERPMTHDLLINFAALYAIHIQKVVITDYQDGVFTTHIQCIHHDKIDQLNARLSDAVAIALRSSTGIYVMETVLKKLMK